MSASSGLGPESAVTVTGSSAIPQIGHAPGPGRRISGCIGQVHSATSPAVAPACGGRRRRHRVPGVVRLVAGVRVRGGFGVVVVGDDRPCPQDSPITPGGYSNVMHAVLPSDIRSAV